MLQNRSFSEKDIEYPISASDLEQALINKKVIDSAMGTEPTQGIKVFCCYARKDERFRASIETHLKFLERSGKIALWYDRKIQPGLEWKNEINRHLDMADLVLLLVSQHFIASNYCYGFEMQRALELHENGKARVIPIILSPIILETTPLAKLQVLPKDAKPIITWKPQVNAFFDIQKSINEVVDVLLSQKMGLDQSIELNQQPPQAELEGNIKNAVVDKNIESSPLKSTMEFMQEESTGHYFKGSEAEDPLPDQLWNIFENTLDLTQKRLRSQESMYTIGNGYFGTRGSFEEGCPLSMPGTLLFGVFNKVAYVKEELANAPDWTSIDLIVNGERFCLNKGKIIRYQRALDMYNGVLSRTVDWESPGGICLKITSERFASLADEHVGVVRFSIVYKGGSTTDNIRVSLRGNFHPTVDSDNIMHWDIIDQGYEQNILWFQTKTKESHIQLTQTMSFTTDYEGYRAEHVPSYIAPSIRIDGTLALGETLSAEKIVVMYTSRDEVDNPHRAALQHHLRLLSPIPSIGGFVSEKLLEHHKEAWHQFWQTADVIIEGDLKAQVAIRYNIYQIRISASLNDNRYSVASRGLTGFEAHGHISSEIEICLLPFFCYVMPDVARNHLLYRYHLLPAARKKAASNGYEGAQYPWESTLDGEEATLPYVVDPYAGGAIPVLNGYIEIHITAIIAHSVWNYWQITGDDNFMTNYGTEILLSTAQFWVSRVEKNHEHNYYEITNIIGPDEWHDHVDNNAFTNYMVQKNIQRALEALSWLHITDPKKASRLEEQLNITTQQLNIWQDIQNKIYIPQSKKSGLIEQFEGFFKLEHLDQSMYKGREVSYRGILGLWALQKYKILQQADVLLLITLLADEIEQKIKKVNWDYYFPLTDYGYATDYGHDFKAMHEPPAWTPALHVLLACQLEQIETAYKLFLQGALVDLEDLLQDTSGGIHTACAGMVWQALIFGFAGLKVSNGTYTTSPIWPNGWTRLAFKIRPKGNLISIDLRR